MPRPRVDFLRRAQRWVRNGYAERTLADYEPFLHVRDVPSRGRSHRVVSWTVGRLHHLLSDLEVAQFYLADYSHSVIDIREQFPLLPVEETLALADRLGVRHPSSRGIVHVMTTDFWLTHQDGNGQLTAVKYAAELESPRVREKLDIEQRYWTNRGYRLQLATEKELPTPLIRAVCWVHGYREPDGLQTGQQPVDAVAATLHRELRANRATPTNLICRRVDREYGFEEGVALSVVRYALAGRRWPVDLRQGIDTLKPLPWLEDA